MKEFLLLPLVLLALHHVRGQEVFSGDVFCDTVHLKESFYLDSLDVYQFRYGSNHRVKTSDKTLRLAYYVALSHYPELKNARVKMRLKSITTTMQAQPNWDFLFRRRDKRFYQIFVNTNENYTGITYKDLSFNSLVGWIGHEMAHLTEYSEKNNVELFQFITSYVLDRNEIERTERKADRATIRHGLGSQLLEGVHFFHKNKKVKRPYREKTEKYYLSAEEIVSDINRHCKDR